MRQKGRENNDSHEPSARTVDHLDVAHTDPPKVADDVNNSSFALDEYARLIVILGDHPKCIEALIHSGKEMSTLALDAKIPRDYFWSSVIENVFNDCTYHRRTLELLGVVDSVHAENSPLCHRFGDRLKD